VPFRRRRARTYVHGAVQSVTKITDFNGATRTRLCCYYFMIQERKIQYYWLRVRRPPVAPAARARTEHVFPEGSTIQKEDFSGALRIIRYYAIAGPTPPQRRAQLSSE
jgi:hypothetical protein